MKTLYVNTYGLQGQPEKEQNGYMRYVKRFAKKNNMKIVEYCSLTNYDDDDLKEGEFIDGDNDGFNGLGLWDDYCSGVRIKKYDL